MSRRRANTNSLVATAAPAQFRGRLALAAALLLATLSVIVVARAGAQGGSGEPGCKQTPNPPCVIMIQVDGLKATDITPEKTPFLYRFMAHPAQGDPPPFDDRHGWIWQAGRSSVNAGLAANTASYLIGGYPEQTGVPADDFRLGHSEGSQRIRLGSDPDAPIPPVTAAEVDNKTLFNLVKENLGDEFDTSAFVGDPNLGPMVVGPLDGEEEEREVSIGWYPTPQDRKSVV